MVLLVRTDLLLSLTAIQKQSILEMVIILLLILLGILKLASPSQLIGILYNY